MTYDKDALAKLLKMVEAGETPEAHEITSALRPLYSGDEPIVPFFRMACDETDIRSMGAALALHNAVLPGWAIDIHERIVGDSRRDGWNAVITDLTGNFWTYETGSDVGAWHKDNPARALLIAIIKALMALEDRTDG